MGDAKMKWDDELKRWRGQYRGKRFSKSAQKLGGTNATDTKVAANQWFEREKAKLDVKLGEKTRRNEAKNRAALEDFHATLQGLVAVRNDPKVAPVIDRIKRNKREVERRLQGKSALPPIDLSLMNPLDISVQEVEKMAARRAQEAFLPTSPENIHSILAFIDYLRSDEKEKYELYENAELKWHLAFLVNNLNLFSGSALVFDERVVDDILPVNLDEEQWKVKAIDMIVGLEMYKKFVMKVHGQSTFEAILEDEMKEDVGAMESDFNRGVLVQKCNAGGLVVSDDKNLFVHLDRFIAYHETRMEGQGLIDGGHLGQIVLRINAYRNWVQGTGVNDIDTTSTKQHANGYFAYIIERKKKGEMAAATVRKYFATFKAFISYLAEEEVLVSMPAWLSRKNGRHEVRDENKEPEPIPVADMRRIYDEARPLVRLFMLLILNCGMGQGEIGRLLRKEYNPATGIITHRREKTKKNPNTPTVTYRLWKRTKELLDQQLEIQKGYPQVPGNEHLLLLNTKGKPLWEEKYVDGKARKNDCIAPVFEKVVKNIRKRNKEFPRYSFYSMRSTSSSAIFKNREFRSLDWLFLGHAPKTTAGQFYNDIDTTILDDCLAWLETYLFESEVVQ